MSVSVSELAALLLKELLSDDIDSVEKDYYKRVLGEISKLERDAGLRGEAQVMRNTLRYIFLYRLEKEIAYLRKHGELPPLELPEEERRVLLLVRELTGVIQGAQASKLGGEVEATAVKTSVAETGGGHEEKRPVRKYVGSIVMFLQPHPRIIDKGLSLGPFVKGDIAHIPRRIAEELEEKGIVEILEEK